MARSDPGRFTTGSTMRHVAVMTMTGMAGLTFMFLVDFVTLLYVSLLGDETLTAGVGFAWGVQFFTISIGIGAAIAATALVARAIGARERERARKSASSALVITVAMLIVAAILVVAFRKDIVTVIGATGDAHDVASRFLMISVPSLPFVGIGMITSSILRAVGDARRAMTVTMCGGLAALALDPLFIFGLGLGVDGAAAAMVLSRMVSAAVGVAYCIRAHDLIAPPSLAAARAFARPFFAVAAPAMATQVSTPLGNLIFTWWMADHGDSAVAGWAVASRLTVLAFGGVFALSSAIGGIFGQNWGAGLAERVGTAYRDSVIFCAGYVALTWALLAIAAPYIVQGFGVSEAGASVVYAFCYVGAAGFMFNGMLFVANAAFNNLGRPLWSTGFNWTRDALVTPAALILMPAAFGAPGGVYAQAVAGVLVGAVAVVVGWRLAHSIRFEPEETAGPAPDWASVPPGGGVSGRAGAQLIGAAKPGEAALARRDGMD